MQGNQTKGERCAMDLISRQAAIDEIRKCRFVVDAIEKIIGLPSAQPDFSCDGCKTPKHICGICMRNYPNITDHYCTGEWAERREE